MPELSAAHIKTVSLFRLKKSSSISSFNNFPKEISVDNFARYDSSKNIFCLISEIFGSPMKLFLAEYAIFAISASK